MKTRFSCLMPAAIAPVVVGAGGLVKLAYAETTDSEELMGGTIHIDLIALDF